MPASIFASLLAILISFFAYFFFFFFFSISPITKYCQRRWYAADVAFRWCFHYFDGLFHFSAFHFRALPRIVSLLRFADIYALPLSLIAFRFLLSLLMIGHFRWWCRWLMITFMMIRFRWWWRLSLRFISPWLLIYWWCRRCGVAHFLLREIFSVVDYFMVKTLSRASLWFLLSRFLSSFHCFHGNFISFSSFSAAWFLLSLLWCVATPFSYITTFDY